MTLSPEDPEIKCLEFFSGIGGFHFALKDISPRRIEVVAAFDINTTANMVYKYNFPETKLYQNNIQALTADVLDNYGVELWTMSPPCQPFTQRGNRLDVGDRRCDALQHLATALKDMKNPPLYIMVENVPGFKESEAEEVLTDALKTRKYTYKSFIVSPTDYGIPNTRKRYYLLARLSGEGVPSFDYETPDREPSPLHTYLRKDADLNKSLFVDPKLLIRHKHVVDIVEPRSVGSSCFTKAYGHYVKGSGSLLATRPRNRFSDNKQAVFSKADFLDVASNDDEENVDALGIRFFSVPEVAGLMGFGTDLKIPPWLTKQQMYRGLGNSVNVVVVTDLLRHLLDAWYPDHGLP